MTTGIPSLPWQPASNTCRWSPRSAPTATIAGVRLPDIAVPRATYTGWNVYKAPFPEGELCDRDGSYAPLPESEAERSANADPRARSRISTAFRRATSKR
jgi:hypothetical protein